MREFPSAAMRLCLPSSEKDRADSNREARTAVALPRGWRSHTMPAMHGIDIAIIIIYMLLMVVVGWVVMKLAARNPDSYFLAGKSLPWWVIGVAHGSSGV